MNWLVWIIFGLIAGAIAKWIHPGNDPGGWIGSIVVGILGAMLGGWLGGVLGLGGVTGFNIGSFLLAVIGSVILLAIYRMVTKK